MFTGSAVAIVTPFADGQIDIAALTKLVELHLANGTQALIPLGTTGEASTLTVEERATVIKAVVAAAKGQIPVIVGIGHNCTSTAIALAQQAEALGADGLLLLTPYYNKTSSRGLVAHFRAVAAATALPIILYNVPSRTSMNLPPAVLVELQDVANIVGVKEASGDIAQVLEIRRLMPPAFAIYSGNDDQVAPVLACGGQGVISVAANIIPSVMQTICQTYLSGQTKAALELQLAYKPLIDQLFCEVNPIPVKAALELMGLIDGELRLPLVPLAPENQVRLAETLRNYGLLPGKTKEPSPCLRENEQCE